MKCTTFDLPKVAPIARRRIETAGLSGRVNAVEGDFFVDLFPKADVITMGMILHDWNLEKKKALICKASGADFISWCREAGFRKFGVIPLIGPSSAAVAYK